MSKTISISTNKYDSPFHLKSRQQEIMELVNRESTVWWAKQNNFATDKERVNYLEELGRRFMESRIKKSILKLW